jgi:CrcB protein
MPNLFLTLSQTLHESFTSESLRAPIAVSLGAVPGALSRYYLTLKAAQIGTSFPYGTFMINLTGSFCIGIASTLLSKWIAIPELQWLVIVGFLGAYTTFSTYALDTSNLLRAGDRKAALFYWLSSPVLGLICVELGIHLALLI